MIKISRTDNGAVLLITGQYDENRKLSYVFDEEDPEGLISLFYEIKSTLINDSKYSEKRVRINLEHGEKYDCKEKNCKICKEDQFR